MSRVHRVRHEKSRAKIASITTPKRGRGGSRLGSGRPDGAGRVFCGFVASPFADPPKGTPSEYVGVTPISHGEDLNGEDKEHIFDEQGMGEASDPENVLEVASNPSRGRVPRVAFASGSQQRSLRAGRGAKVRRVLIADSEAPESEGRMFDESGNVTFSAGSESAGSSRRGAPITAYRYSKQHKSVTMHVRTFRRMLRNRRNLDRKLSKSEMERKRLERLFKSGRVFKPAPKAMRVAVYDVLQTLGLSANQAWKAIAASSMLFFRKVFAQDICAVSTSLEYLRILGTHLNSSIISKINQVGKQYFIGLDTSERGGSTLASYVVSFVESAEPVLKFLSFNLPEGSDANSLTNALDQILNLFPNATLGGIATDGVVTMVGQHNGVGVKLCERFSRFVRHDTCEHHAAALVLKSLEIVWPAQMNKASVTQFCYLAWYILNDNWPLARQTMHKILTSDEIPERITEMLEKMFPDIDRNSRAKVLLKSKLLNKPAKPCSSRWGTLLESFRFVHKFVPYFSLFLMTFDEQQEEVQHNLPPFLPCVISGFAGPGHRSFSHYWILLLNLLMGFGVHILTMILAVMIVITASLVILKFSLGLGEPFFGWTQSNAF